MLVNLARYYNDAYLIVEKNNHGLTTLKSILETEYWNIYYQKTYDKLNDVITKKLGFTTNKKSKPMIIDKLQEYIREKYISMWDMDIVKECYTYVIDEKGATNAQEGCHDDCVMSLALALTAVLEGRGEDYLPEIPIERIKINRKLMFDQPEVIDKLFERAIYNDGNCMEGDVEYTI